MRFWFLIAGGFTLIIFSAEISVFLSNFFAYSLRHILSIFVGVFAFLVLSAKKNETGFRNVVSKVSYVAFFVCVIIFFSFWILAYFFEKVGRNELWLFLIFSMSSFFIFVLFDRFFTPIWEKINFFCTKNKKICRQIYPYSKRFQATFADT